MSFIIVFSIVTAVLFLLAFITKRRFGGLGLALAAGATLSTLWVGSLTPVIAQVGFVLVKPPLESVVQATIILLPALLLLMSGPTYQSARYRISGALAFAALAVALLLQPLGSALIIDGVGEPVYAFMVQWRTVIITLGLMLAIGDLLVTKTPKLPPKH